MQTLIGLGGIVLLLLIAWLLSADRKAINKRTIVLAFALQVGIAALILYVPFGRDLLGGPGHQHAYESQAPQELRFASCSATSGGARWAALQRRWPVSCPPAAAATSVPTAFAAPVAAGYDPRGFQVGVVHTF